MKHPKATIIVFLVAAFALAACAQGEDATQPVATVNTHTITHATLLQGCLARFGPQVLENMIVAEAIEQAAVKSDVTVSTEELVQRYLDAKRDIEMRAPVTGMNFNTWLHVNDLTPEFYSQNIYMTLLLEKMVAPLVNITDQQVAKYYQANRDKLMQPEKVNVAHICVSSEAKAEEIRADILAGRIAFADAAKAHSIDPYTKDNAGEWGHIVAGNDPFQQAAFELTKDGEISPVFQSKMGYHIVKRLGRSPAQVPPFEDIQDTLKQNLVRARFAQLTQQRKEDILEAAQIERLLDTFGRYPVTAGQPQLQAPPTQPGENP
jgi:foldase protein PrsA